MPFTTELTLNGPSQTLPNKVQSKENNLPRVFEK